MNGIIGTTELVSETNLDHRQRRYIEMISYSAEALLTIINDILDFSKIEAGKLNFETIDFDLRAIVENVMELMSERVNAKELKLSLIFSPAVPAKLRGDPVRLHQILTNLVGNAVKFTDCGEVTIRISKQSEKEQRVTILCDVTDTGIGISEDDQKILFAPFTQADGSATRRYGGTGLGLAIAKQLVEMMGGTILVTSKPKAGSCFSFTATFIKQGSQEPQSQAGLNPPQPPEVTLKGAQTARASSAYVMPGEPNGHGGVRELITAESLNKLTPLLTRKVLLVEDNEVNQVVASDQLTLLGYHVNVASNGQEALDALSLRSYDAVLMDCGMPVMDGYAATGEIRKREGTARHTPIIAMTAHAMTGDRERCLAAGMDAYLAKPVKRQTLEGMFAMVFGDGGLSAAQRVEPVPATTAPGHSELVNVESLRDLASTPEKLKHIIGLYLHHTEERLEELDTGVKQNSPSDVYAVAHKCLGSSSTFGMTAIVPSLTELQRMGKAGDLQGATAQVDDAQEAFEKLKGFLEIYCKQLPAEERLHE